MEREISEAHLQEILHAIRALQAQGGDVEDQILELEQYLSKCYVTRRSKLEDGHWGAPSEESLDETSVASEDLSVCDGRPEGNFWFKKGNRWRCVSTYSSIKHRTLPCICWPVFLVSEIATSAIKTSGGRPGLQNALAARRLGTMSWTMTASFLKHVMLEKHLVEVWSTTTFT